MHPGTYTFVAFFFTSSLLDGRPPREVVSLDLRGGVLLPAELIRVDIVVIKRHAIFQYWGHPPAMRQPPRQIMSRAARRMAKSDRERLRQAQNVEPQ